jgi:hypothetical protein
LLSTKPGTISGEFAVSVKSKISFARAEEAAAALNNASTNRDNTILPRFPTFSPLRDLGLIEGRLQHLKNPVSSARMD